MARVFDPGAPLQRLADESHVHAPTADRVWRRLVLLRPELVAEVHRPAQLHRGGAVFEGEAGADRRGGR